MKNTQAYQQAVAQCESIAAMVAALEVDYDRLDELREREYGAEVLTPDELAELDKLTQQAGDCDDYDDALERILEDPLDIEVRSGWVSNVSELEEPEEYRITLCCGGPAVCITGELGQYGEPESARVIYQGGGMPWTELVDKPVSDDVLLKYCRQFHYTMG